MSSNKGISFQIVLIIVAIAAGAVALLVVGTVSKEAVKNADYGCLFGNSFKNLLPDASQDESMYCKTELTTIRPPDLDSSTIFKKCNQVMFAENDFQKSKDKVNENPDAFVQDCIAYQVMNNAERCWSNYLLGEAEFDGTCNRICFQDGFTTYSLDKRNDVIQIPNVEGASVKFYPGEFNSAKPTIVMINNLKELNDISNYGISFNIVQYENYLSIEYVKSLAQRNKKYSIVQQIPVNVPIEELNDAIALIESDTSRSGLYGNSFGMESSDNVIESGEEWEITYIESVDLALFTVGGAYLGSSLGFVAGGVGAYIGSQIDKEIGSIEDSAITINKRGGC